RNDACTDAGACLGGPPPDCIDANLCTDDGCDPASGCFHHPNTAACDDGNVCTLDDRCANSTCNAGPPLDCSDGDPCTDDVCDSATGCSHSPVPQCTGDVLAASHFDTNDESWRTSG